MTTLQHPLSTDRQLASQVFSQIETKLLATKTYRQALAALDNDSPPARTVLDAHLRAIGRTSMHLVLAELKDATAPSAAPPTVEPIATEPPATETPEPPAIAPQVPPPMASNDREAACQVIGSALQQARLARSLSLEQVARQTKIQAHRIAALEAGQLAQVEDDVYLRGFIRRLAAALHLDLPELLAMLPETPPLVRPSWDRRHDASQRDQTAMRYVSYTAAVAALLGGLAWAAEQAAAAPSMTPAPTAQVQTVAAEAMPPASLSIAPPDAIA